MKAGMIWTAACAAAISATAGVELSTSENRVESPLRVSMKRVGTLAPRGVKDIRSSNWTLGCEVLDRDFAKFDEYKRFLAPLGIKKIRLQAGWAKCERVKGVYDFSWLDHQVDYALAQGIAPMLETGYGNPVYPGGGGWDLAGGFPTSEEGLAGWDAWVDALSKHFATRVRDQYRVAFFPGVCFTPDYTGQDHSVRFTFARQTDEQMAEGVRRIAKALNETA